MKKSWIISTAALAAGALMLVSTNTVAFGGQKSAKKSVAVGPENGLVGIRIYDDAVRVISIYGNPDSISSVSVGGTSDAGGDGGGRGGFGGPPGAGAGGAPRAGAGGGAGRGGPAGASADEYYDPLIPGSFMDGMRQRGAPMGGPSAPPGGPPQGGPGGPPRGGAGAGKGDSDGGAPGGGTGAGNETTQFTRWSYMRNGTKLGFVVDKFNRVVQIEATGLQNQRVKTKRGVGFGSSFGTIIKAYSGFQEPDGYDIAGDNFTIRFLTRARVAFRMTRLSTKKSHVVTGIVVAAGKK